MEINYNPTLIKGINQCNFKKNQNATLIPQSSNSSNNSEKAFSVTISNEAKIKSSQNYLVNPDYPPDYAPQAVKDAWRLVTSKLEPKVAALITRGPFIAAELSANLKFDSSGAFVGVRHRGDEGYVDIYSQPGFSYREHIERLLNDLDLGGGRGRNKMYQETKQFLNDLDQAYLANGVV